MAASSTSRPDTQETAAYAASQPLFDVLRGAISRIEEQKVYLTGAKDTVQHIHVKVPQEHVANNGTLPHNYRDSLVTAWKITTESYVRIFEQLCELTGPDPAAGRQAEDSYAGFQKLLYTAEAARTVAFEQDAENEKAKGKAESDSESASGPSSGVNTPNKKTQHTPAEVASIKRVAEPSPSQNGQRPAKKQRTTPSETTGTPAEEATASQANSQPTINTVQRLKPKQVRKERKQRIQQHRDQQEQKQQASAAQPPEPANSTPQVQYIDPTAEVDARIRAKEEQKKAKAKAKKRKRDSSGSHILEAEPGAEKEAAETRAKALAQKPAKKRAKSANGEGVRVDGQEKKVQHAKGKRGIEDEGNGQKPRDAGEGARRSKRKKT